MASFALVGSLGACASAPDPSDVEAVEEYERINDPFEPLNRTIFEANLALDLVVLEPAARAYRWGVPEVLRVSVANVLNLLTQPVNALNALLQGDLKHAGHTVGRFVVNATFGVAGLADVATEMGLPNRPEDFGQTLAVWGVEDGPYLMLPLMGPSNPRDGVGRIADYFADPFNHWADNTRRNYAVWTRTGVDTLKFREQNLELIDDLQNSSLDFYATVRSLYRQRRGAAISNGDNSDRVPAPSIGMDFEPLVSDRAGKASLDEQVSSTQQ